MEEALITWSKKLLPFVWPFWTECYVEGFLSSQTLRRSRGRRRRRE
jgi:hypothetical protein